LIRGREDIEGYRRLGFVGQGGKGEFVLMDGRSLIPHIKLGVTEDVLGVGEGCERGAEGEGEGEGEKLG
jgi:hypothetical protein